MKDISRTRHGQIYIIGLVATTFLDTWLIYKLPVQTLAILGTIAFPITYFLSSYLYNCENTTFNVFSNGTHTVKVTAGTLTDTNSFSVSFDAPSITLTSPSNSSVMANGTVLVSYVASEIPAGDLESCELWGNFNGTYMKNQTNSTVLSGSTSQFTITSLKNGTYLWAISCLDKESHRSTTGNWTFSVDTIPPAIVLSDPKGMYNRTSLLPLNFSVQDTSPVTCGYNVTSITGGPAVISRSVPG
jgi:hypothetical protein